MPPDCRKIHLKFKMFKIQNLQPDFGAQDYSSTQAFTVLPGTHFNTHVLREHTCGQSALPRSRTSEQEPSWSVLSVWPRGLKFLGLADEKQFTGKMRNSTVDQFPNPPCQRDEELCGAFSDLGGYEDPGVS